MKKVAMNGPMKARRISLSSFLITFYVSIPLYNANIKNTVFSRGIEVGRKQ